MGRGLEGAPRCLVRFASCRIGKAQPITNAWRQPLQSSRELFGSQENVGEQASHPRGEGLVQGKGMETRLPSAEPVRKGCSSIMQMTHGLVVSPFSVALVAGVFVGTHTTWLLRRYVVCKNL